MSYSPDGTATYKPCSGAGINDGQKTKLYATFPSGGYYKVQFSGHVNYYTSCQPNALQQLDTVLYTDYFAVNQPDFDFSVTDIGVNQGESGTFISKLTSIHGFTGTVKFTDADFTDKIFGVIGSGSTPGTAPITIRVIGNGVVGHSYPVDVRGDGTVGGTDIYHDKTVNVTILKRGVTITDGVSPTYHKGNSGQPESDSVADGATHNAVRQATIVYTAVPTGYWNINSLYYWNTVTGTKGDMPFDTFTPDVPDALHVGYSDSQYSPDEHIHIRLDDADGIPTHYVTGNYYVHWHKPIENCIYVKDLPDYWQPFPATNPETSIAMAGNTIHCTFAFGGYLIGQYINDVGAGFVIGAEFTPPPWDVLCAALGWIGTTTPPNLGLQYSTDCMNSIQAWNEASSLQNPDTPYGLAGTNNVNEWESCKMSGVPYMSGYYHVKLYNCDEYDNSGFKDTIGKCPGTLYRNIATCHFVTIGP